MDSSLLSYEERLWQQLYDGAWHSLKGGQHDDALRDFETAVNVAEEFGQSDERLAKSLTGLGMTQFLRRQYSLAEKPLERAFELNSKFRGLANRDTLSILKQLGMVALSLEKLDLADKYFTQAIELSEKLEPNNAGTKALREHKELVAKRLLKSKGADGQLGPSVKPAKPKSTVTIDLNKPSSVSDRANKDGNGGTARPRVDVPAPPGRAAEVPVEMAKPRSNGNVAPRSMNSVDPDNLSGATVDNRYEIYGRIGEGGMSAIYRGKHILMDRMVAIKILHKHLTLSEKVKQRFMHESRTASKLQHPNIVGVHDFGEEAHGFFFLVMDFVDGVSLADLIKDVERVSPERCVHILQQICDGLQHAHDNGILHRDLKPSNIMLVNQSGSPDFVKIVDFGIAKVIEKEDSDEHALQLTQTGETVGSPLYMSPEQCRGERLDPRSDIYSLGCLAYKALSGVPPFGGNNQIDVYIKHTQVPPPPFEKSVPGLKVPPQLEMIVMKMLAKNPDHRFSSMNEVRGALNLLAAEQGW